MRFLAMANHYVFEPAFCNPAAGWEKGQVEKNVQDARHRLWQLMPSFPDLVALNDWLEQRCVALWTDIPHGTLPGNVADIWAAEQAALMPLPPAFDGFVELSKRVSPTCLISFERNRYSVPASFANRPVKVAGLSRTSGGRSRGSDPVRACAGDPAQSSTPATHDLRLAPLPGRPSA